MTAYPDHIRIANQLLTQQGTINDLRAREAALAHAVLAMRTDADQRDPSRVRAANVPLDTAALALGTLLRWCEMTPLPALTEWLQDRVAAADLADLLDARDRETVSVWIDSRTIERAHNALGILIMREDMPDIEVARLAATDLANALNELDSDRPTTDTDPEMTIEETL